MLVAAESTRMVTRSKSGVGVKPGGEGKVAVPGKSSYVFEEYSDDL